VLCAAYRPFQAKLADEVAALLFVGGKRTECCSPVDSGHSGHANFGVALGHFVAGIMVLNPIQGTELCLRPSVVVFCCTVSVVTKVKSV
jgi:hypothetical protein